MKEQGAVLFVDDERAIRVAGQQILELTGFSVTTCENAEQALWHLAHDWPGIVISDVRMPGMDGITLMNRIKSIDHEIPVILITGYGDISMAVQAIREGAYDFIAKPYPSELLVDVVRRALERRRLIIENRALKAELAGQGGTVIIGKSVGMELLRVRIAKIADTDTDVLIVGETGTGKDLVARALHERSVRRSHHFVALNCGAIQESMFESELFGHEAGAFTGANKRRIGRIEYANGGTLFLDEIESMPLALQVKILRVLQERVVEPLGGNKVVPVDIRVVTASKNDLLKLATEGCFREDLYFRLGVAIIKIPPLRERREDIPLLFQYFADIAAVRCKRDAPALEATQINRLISHAWPGNVRELRNAAERFVLGLDDDLNDLTDEADQNSDSNDSFTLVEKVDLFEKTVIEGELVKQQGNIKAACAALGLPRRTLYDKLKRHNLSRDDYVG